MASNLRPEHPAARPPAGPAVPLADGAPAGSVPADSELGGSGLKGNVLADSVLADSELGGSGLKGNVLADGGLRGKGVTGNGAVSNGAVGNGLVESGLRGNGLAGKALAGKVLADNRLADSGAKARTGAAARCVDATTRPAGAAPSHPAGVQAAQGGAVALREATAAHQETVRPAAGVRRPQSGAATLPEGVAAAVSPACVHAARSGVQAPPVAVSRVAGARRARGGALAPAEAPSPVTNVPGRQGGAVMRTVAKAGLGRKVRVRALRGVAVTWTVGPQAGLGREVHVRVLRGGALLPKVTGTAVVREARGKAGTGGVGLGRAASARETQGRTAALRAAEPGLIAAQARRRMAASRGSRFPRALAPTSLTPRPGPSCGPCRASLPTRSRGGWSPRARNPTPTAPTNTPCRPGSSRRGWGWCARHPG